MIDVHFWRNKKVLITGHTGFKGSWLCLLLNKFGAEVYGYSLDAPTQPNLYGKAFIENDIKSTKGDIRDLEKLKDFFYKANPDIVIHLAAQPIVRESYKDPINTYLTNVIGTANVFEAVRQCRSVRVCLNVTTDKVYENKEWHWGYRENDRLGGYDPYSSSKACSEIVTDSYRSAFFNPLDYFNHRVAIATARAGNVIGGGDWANDRIIPDCIRAIKKRNAIIIRNPSSTRPWQHVLEPLGGYLHLCKHLFTDGASYSEAWNFGPDEDDIKSVRYVVEKVCKLWGEGAAFIEKNEKGPHESSFLKLDCSKAKSRLMWSPVWNLNKALEKTIEWYKCYSANDNVKNMCLKQIDEWIEANN